jgi:hypothetical protein
MIKNLLFHFLSIYFYVLTYKLLKKQITKNFQSANDMQVPTYKFCYILNKLTAATRNPKDSLLSSTEIAMI